MKEKQEIISKLEAVIELHEKMQGSYFYTPPRIASKRRFYEEANSLKTEFEYDGDSIVIEQVTNCSRRNVYYAVTYYINGKSMKKDIRFVKKICDKLKKAICEEETNEDGK